MDTFTEAADEAGISRRYGDIHSAQPISPDACWDVE